MRAGEPWKGRLYTTVGLHPEDYKRVKDLSPEQRGDLLSDGLAAAEHAVRKALHKPSGIRRFWRKTVA